MAWRLFVSRRFAFDHGGRCARLSLLSLPCGEQKRQNLAHMEMTTLPLGNSLNRSRLGAFLLIPFVLACFMLSPQAQATCQEGCDTNTGNTFLGDEALINNTTGYDNTGIGSSALLNNTVGFNNTAYGHSALLSNTAGFDNTAIGLGALLNNTTGIDNTATGAFALEFNTYGTNNTANGYMALTTNTSGNYNTAIGFQALLSNSTGSCRFRSVQVC